MKFFKNINEGKDNLLNLIDVKKNQVTSLALSKVKNADIRLFGFYQNEMIRNEIYPCDVMYICLDGSLLIKDDTNEYILLPNDVASFEEGNRHSITALENSKMLQIMIGEK